MQITCPSIGLFKSFRVTPSLIFLKSLISTRWCWGTKLGWLFLYAKWYSCWLFVLFSKLMSSKWSWCSRLAIERGTKYLCFTFQLERVLKNNRIREEIAQSKAHRSHKYVNNAWSEISNSPPTLLFIPFPVPPHWQTIWDNYFSPSLF